MLGWPVVQQLLEQCGPKVSKYVPALSGQDAAAFAFRVMHNDKVLPSYGRESLSSNPRTSLGTLQLQVPASSNAAAILDEP
jgi:hypothetical protein